VAAFVGGGEIAAHIGSAVGFAWIFCFAFEMSRRCVLAEIWRLEMFLELNNFSLWAIIRM
jgi:hypothetical protein